MGGLLRAEQRKSFSTKLWWALLIPVALLSILINVSGGLFTDVLAADGTELPLLLGSLAYALVVTSTFAMVYGVVAAASEFRHRTITTTYLTTSGRGSVLLAKMVVSAAIGVLYALVAVVPGVLAGLVGGSALPDTGPLLTVAAIGAVVSALWSALGTALGTAISNQAGSLVTGLVYVLLGELMISLLLTSSESAPVRQLSAYLPVNAGEVALYEVPARALGGARYGGQVVEAFAGVSAPPPAWAALLVLAAWTATVGATGWVVAGRRDVA